MRRSLLTLAWPCTLCLLAGLAACSKSQVAATDGSAGNPADGNLAPATEVSQSEAPQSSQAPQSYAPAPAPSDQQYAQPQYSQTYYPPPGGTEEPAVEASEPPPPLPEYTQPPCPGENYVWTPGYWDWSNAYYWVPGAWVLAPWVGALWTPPWWGFVNGVYVYNAGYWGPHIGFYGGIDYGFGYPGRGYYGAYWNRGQLFYNRDVTNVNITSIHNYYTAPVPRIQQTRVSFNGGRGGIEMRPTAQELAVRRDPRLAAVPAQVQQARQAAGNRAQFAGAGNRPPAALTAAHPLATNYHAPEQRPPEAAVRAAARPAAAPTPANRGPAPQHPAAPERAQNQPNTQPRQGQAERTTPPPRPEQHAVAPRPEQPARPQAQARPEPQRAAPARPQPQARPEEHATAPRPEQPPRPQAQARPEPQRAAPARPQPQARPEQHAVAPRPEQPARPQAQARPEPQRAAPARPQPQARPEPQRAPASRPAAAEQQRKEEQH
jgi:hypothetical protein